MMADLPGDFWGGWIVVLTVSSLVGLSWLVYSIYFSRKKTKHVSPVWDETLEEGDHPAPMWWFWMMLAALVITVIYLMLYPGLGTFKGVLQWSQGGRLEQSIADYEEQFGDLRRSVAKMSLEEIQSSPLVMDSAARTFDRSCGICHGHEGEGQADRFPNLIDHDWQWGGSPEQIEVSIRQGRRAAMPGWQAALGEQGITQMVDYLQVMGQGDQLRSAHPAHLKYQQLCAACHGADGRGNPVLGAPNLVDDIWLYGDSDEVLTTTLIAGRNGHMPAFEQRLDDTQVRMLVAWLLSQQSKGNSGASSTP